MKITLLSILTLWVGGCVGLNSLDSKPEKGKAPASSMQDSGDIKAYCVDLNWEKVPGKHRSKVARPGVFAKTNPADHFAWYKMLGVNVIQTFCVSTNGYAWYKNGVVPEQPGLAYDYLPEMVRLGHAEGMKVFGYYTIGFNPRWAKLRPDQNYTTGDDGGVGGGGYHIVYTDDYLEFLSESISDAVVKTGIDGFMIDWLWQPRRRVTKGKWIKAEIDLYEQLMGKTFPGEDYLTVGEEQAYSRKALTRAWRAIRKAAKDVRPECIIWLTVNSMDHPHMLESDIYQEMDWLMNEAGDMKRINNVKGMVGGHTRLITCMAAWTGVNATDVVPKALKAGIGLYGFSKPYKKNVDDLAALLAKPVWGLKGDDRNIATLARAYHGVDLNTLRNGDGEWVPVPAPPKKLSANEQKPNVVLITADDLPWTDLGIMGLGYAKTPHLDALARKGAFFPRAYVPTPWSRSSLMTFLTGRYAHTHGITSDEDVRWTGAHRARASTVTPVNHHDPLPKLLQKAGYLSYQSGRWFEGDYKTAGFTHGNSQDDSHSYDLPGIGSDAMSSCLEFIDHAKEAEKPFMLWYSPALPAFNFNSRAPEKLGVHDVPNGFFHTQRHLLGYGMKDGFYQFEGPRERPYLTKYYALIEWFDHHCGQLIQHLEKRGLLKNTLVIFQSSNGMVTGGRKKNYLPRTKGSPYDGGVRTPAIYYWQGKIIPGTRSEVVSSVDVVPTILAATGSESPKRSLPGIDLLSMLEGKGELEDRPLFGESYDRDQGEFKDPERRLLARWVIHGAHKLIIHYDGTGSYAGGNEKRSSQPELFDLVEDPYEQNNLYPRNPQIASKLRAELEKWYDLQERKERTSTAYEATAK